MNEHSRTPMRVWCLLCALTFASVALVEGGWWREASSVAIVLIAAVKSRLVIVHYMEARRAARHWRFLYEMWNFALAATIVMGWFLSLNTVSSGF